MSIVVVKILDSRITKKHRLVPMTHSYLFDCKITKFFVDHGLKQSECDQCVFSNGGSIFFSESGEDIQDILYLQQDLFEVQGIYSKSILSITQVQDTGISSPEGASYHTRISGAWQHVFFQFIASAQILILRPLLMNVFGSWFSAYQASQILLSSITFARSQ